MSNGKVSRKAMSWYGTLFWQVLVLVLLLLIWEAARRLGLGRAVVLQGPGAVWTALVNLLAGDELWPNFWATIWPMLTALFLSAVVGIPLGLVLGLLGRVDRIVAPYLSALNSMPRIALAPIFIIIFGIDSSAKVALAFSVVVFIMILNARAGVSAADPEAMRMMTTLGASKRQIITKVVLPAAVPSILSGFRLGLIYALLGVITSELIAAKDGLGQLIAVYAASFNLATVYAILVILMITAASMNGLSEVIERRLLRWQPPMAA